MFPGDGKAFNRGTSTDSTDIEHRPHLRRKIIKYLPKTNFIAASRRGVVWILR
jgi:hypothetical protein